MTVSPEGLKGSRTAWVDHPAPGGRAKLQIRHRKCPRCHTRYAVVEGDDPPCPSCRHSQATLRTVTWNRGWSPEVAPDAQPGDEIWEGDYDSAMEEHFLANWSFWLPGTGEPQPGCGRPKRMKCHSCGHRWTKPAECRDRECPNCWSTWCWSTADDGARRIWTAFRFGLRRARVLHVVVGLHKTVTVTPENLPGHRAAAIRELARWGAIGGCLVHHPWRDSEEARAAWRTTDSNRKNPHDPAHLDAVMPENDPRVPSFCDEDGRPSRYCVPGNHFHALVIVPGSFDAPRCARCRDTPFRCGRCMGHLPEEEGGIAGVDPRSLVVKHVPCCRNPAGQRTHPKGGPHRGCFAGQKGIKNVRAVLNYQLSHAGLADRRHAVSWFGCLNRAIWNPRSWWAGIVDGLPVKDRPPTDWVTVDDSSAPATALRFSEPPDLESAFIENRKPPKEKDACPRCGSRDTCDVDIEVSMHAFGVLGNDVRDGLLNGSCASCPPGSCGWPIALPDPPSG